MNIVFLGINGVICPYNSFKRFEYMKTDLVYRLSCINNIDYFQYNSYDVCAAYADWDKNAIEKLRYILNVTNSKIIIVSSLRDSNNKYKMRDLLKIHNLDSYWIGDNEYCNEAISFYKSREKEIKNSINMYQVDNYVILDDMVELISFFPNNFVCTRNIIQESDVKNCIKILKK